MNRFWLRRALRFLAFGLLFGGLAGFLTMTLWNALLPDIVGVRPISFGQALGLLVLSRLLLGVPRGGYGFGRGGSNRGSRTAWRQQMAERWQQMTPEQRAQFKNQWRARCGKPGEPNQPTTGRPDSPGSDAPTPTAI